MSNTRAGILGTGRLGKALALRLRNRCDVAVCDINPKLAKQFAKQNGLSFLPEEQLYSFADFLILCIPPVEIEKVVLDLEGRSTGVSMVLNTATSTDTPELLRRLGLRRIKLIGLKPIGQFTAIQHGVKVVFVTAHDDMADLRSLSEIFADIGVIRRGDERVVQALNRAATRLALQFGRTFLESVQSITPDSEWALSALKSCAAGTILDYPPDPGNPYTSALLAGINGQLAFPAGVMTEEQ